MKKNNNIIIQRKIFFFKQKASYEMRMSDWRSDVCSSDLLLGGPVPVGLTVPLTLADQKNVTVIAAGLPSELMVTRPDILAAEEKLRAARANIGAARAAFFPSISLTGSIGFASTDLGNLIGNEGLS